MVCLPSALGVSEALILAPLSPRPLCAPLPATVARAVFLRRGKPSARESAVVRASGRPPRPSQPGLAFFAGPRAAGPPAPSLHSPLSARPPVHGARWSCHGLECVLPSLSFPQLFSLQASAGTAPAPPRLPSVRVSSGPSSPPCRVPCSYSLAAFSG